MAATYCINTLSCTALLYLLRLCLLGSLVLLVPVAPVSAQESTDRAEPSWQLNVKIKTLFNSHTSYEFGNPTPPYQQPLSRLEFPVDSVWAGLAVRKQLSRFSVGAEFLTTALDQETGRFKDTDWSDSLRPRRITNYGETGCRLTTSYQAGADMDLQLADLVHLPKSFDLKPVVGFRWQRLSLVAHDGTQSNYDLPGMAPTVQILPGDLVSFQQNWYQFFTGLRFGYDWQKPVSWLHHLKLQTQLDWSYLRGENRDDHLLQTSRISTAHTSGDAWHTSFGLLFGLTKNLELGIEADYLNLQTTGTYTLSDGKSVVGWSNGVKVWSEQASILVTLGYGF